MGKTYNRINWEDAPSINTPINATNLNKMDSAIDELDNRVVSLGGFTPVIDESGKITGYKTEIGGADTVFPFSGSLEPYFYNISNTYDASTDGTTTIITTLDTTNYSKLNLYITAIAAKNSAKSNIQLYDVWGNFITETGVLANQNQGVIENLDISNYNEINIRIVGTATASGKAAKIYLSTVCY